MQQMTFTEMHAKWSVTLAGRLGPEVLTVFLFETAFTMCLPAPLRGRRLAPNTANETHLARH